MASSQSEPESSSSVGELRQWLSEFGKKNREHFKKGRDGNRPTGNITPTTTPKKFQQRMQHFESVSSSSTSTSPITSLPSSPPTIFRFATTAVLSKQTSPVLDSRGSNTATTMSTEQNKLNNDFSIPEKGYWTDEDAYCCRLDDNDDGSSLGSGLQSEPATVLMERLRNSNKHMNRRGIISHSPPKKVVDIFSLGPFNRGASFETSKDDSEIGLTTTMHSAKLFKDQMIPSKTLDLICNNTNELSFHSSMFMSKSSIDQARLSIGESEDGTVSSTWSTSDDSARPSIVPGAVDPKLSKIFYSPNSSESNDDTLAENTFTNTKRPNVFQFYSPLALARSSISTSTAEESDREDDKKDEQILSVNDNTKCDVMLSSSSSPVASSFEGKIVARKNNHNHCRSSTSSGRRIGAIVNKFGGEGSRKSLIQQKKEALESQFASTRAPKHVKKIKWQTCPITGAYKKKVVVDKM